MKPEKQSHGRPSKYTPERAKRICELMADGENLEQVCRRHPELEVKSSTVRGWVLDHPEFAVMYARAHQLLMDYKADQLDDICADGRNDWIEKEIRNSQGEVIGRQTVLNTEHVQRSRLRADTLKWELSKLNRAKFGDTVDVNLGGQPGNPVRTKNVDDMTDEELQAIAAAAAKKPKPESDS